MIKIECLDQACELQSCTGFDQNILFKLIDALRHYHRKYIDKNRMFWSKPVHDWSSHACDAMRYLAVGLQEINTRQSAPQSVADNSYRII